MKVYNLKRGHGKTTRLIYISEFTGTPILCVDENHNGKINDAIEFLKTSHCISKLVDEKYRDQAFRTKFLKTYAVILTDINEVKSELKTHLTEEPFNWLGSASAERLLSDIAYHKYNNGGSKLADEIVDTMNPQDLKDYIKKLIKENMAVGIEIIKTKKQRGDL